MDKTLLLLINREWTCSFLDRLMAIFSDSAIWVPVLAAAGLALFCFGRFRGRSFVLVTLLTIGFTDGVFTQSMKKLISRPRPPEALAEVREVSLSKTKPALLAVFEPVKVIYSSPPTGPVAGRSFPSGHAMNNSVLATLAILFFGRLGMWYILPAAMVSYSRIYTGSHWASDVVVSCILGVGFALLIAGFFAIAYQYLASRFFPRLYAKHPALFDRSPE